MFESEHAVAYGINSPLVWFVVRGRAPAPGYGHLALAASGKAAVDGAHRAGLANGGSDDGAPGKRPQYGQGYTPPTCEIPTASASRWFPADTDLSLHPNCRTVR